MRVHEGAHPCIGALDVVPIVYLRKRRPRAGARRGARGRQPAGGRARPAGVRVRGAGAARTTGASARSSARAAWPRSPSAWRRASWRPTSAPRGCIPTAGATLVGARPPLVAFNVELDTADVDVAKAIAAKVREADGGLPGVRAIGVKLATRGVAQVSTNVHDPFAVPLARGRRGGARARPSRWAPRVAGGRARRTRARGGARRLSRPTSSCAASTSAATSWRTACPRGAYNWRHGPARSAGARSTAAPRPGPSVRPPGAAAQSRARRAQTSEQRRQEKQNQPPTWRGAIDARRDRGRQPLRAAGAAARRARRRGGRAVAAGRRALHRRPSTRSTRSPTGAGCESAGIRIER